MVPDVSTLEPWLTQMVSRLSVEFGGAVSPLVVTGVVVGARQDVTGQIVPEARDEMVYRLARHRLTQIDAERD